MREFIEAAIISVAVIMAILFGTWVHDALRSTV
jgi:hypothetical protein